MTKLKQEYEDCEDGDCDIGEGRFTFGYKQVSSHPNSKPYFYIDSESEGITLEMSPAHLRKFAMRLIKLSYRVDSSNNV